jgi:hypothetical protein
VSEKQLTKAQQEAVETEARRTIRQFFTMDKGGDKLLLVLLTDWRFFDEATTPEQIALRNYAVVFVRDRLGIRDVDSRLALVQAMLKNGK